MADDTTTEQTADDTTPKPTPATVPPAAKRTSATEPADDGEDTLGTPGKAALVKERRRALEAERAKREAEKGRKDLERRLKEFEDRDKSEAEKAAERAAGAEKRIQVLLDRAVKAEVRALAVADFADPADAIAFLDLSAYADDDGEIDSERIKADLADLLERKPHLAKKPPAEPEKRRPPAPDMTQASSANKPSSSSPADEFAGFLNARLRGSSRR
jgi:hypothetical protein